MLQFDGDVAKELHVRTCVARNVQLDDFTDMTIEQIRERAKSNEPKAKQELLEVYGLFASEYDYRTIDLRSIPYRDFIVEYARTRTTRFLHSYGAIQSLERLLTLTADDGFILINDYGQTVTTRDENFEHQRFGLSTFVGINFPLLKAYFDRPGTGEWIEPNSELGGIHTRLLCRKRSLNLVVKFWERFSANAYERLQEPIQKARAFSRAGRVELAATFYNEALELQPRNWVLLSEISMFLSFSLRDGKAGVDMAKTALALNPTCSAELWNTLGDGLFEFGRIDEARSAYLKALQVNESDVRARLNLAFCHERAKNFTAALEMIAQAMALDKVGEYRDRLTQKHQEIMGHIGRRNQQEYLLLINLISKYTKKEESDNETT